VPKTEISRFRQIYRIGCNPASGELQACFAARDFSGAGRRRATSAHGPTTAAVIDRRWRCERAREYHGQRCTRSVAVAAEKLAVSAEKLTAWGQKVEPVNFELGPSSFASTSPSRQTDDIQEKSATARWI